MDWSFGLARIPSCRQNKHLATTPPNPPHSHLPTHSLTHMATPAPICTDLRPSTLAGTCGLSEADWSAIQELVSGTPAVRRRAFFIAKRAGPTDGVWLEFLEARVGSAMAVDLPVAGAFNWSEESLECVLTPTISLPPPLPPYPTPRGAG